MLSYKILLLSLTLTAIICSSTIYSSESEEESVSETIMPTQLKNKGLKRVSKASRTSSSKVFVTDADKERVSSSKDTNTSSKPVIQSNILIRKPVCSTSFVSSADRNESQSDLFIERLQFLKEQRVFEPIMKNIHSILNPTTMMLYTNFFDASFMSVLIMDTNYKKNYILLNYTRGSDLEKPNNPDDPLNLFNPMNPLNIWEAPDHRAESTFKIKFKRDGKELTFEIDLKGNGSKYAANPDKAMQIINPMYLLNSGADKNKVLAYFKHGSDGKSRKTEYKINSAELHKIFHLI
ncbi:hypothetical protein NEMIN01_0661 [Nematocida minor]|uniref:uncharacterized protein n=1 Tax=Nematocida minor TaxID=1912983 RepID=UPI00221F21C4|nr:uncharacterized protein NEMIN01_0661 [Nematocida minor]KAI5189708.1 hypothetical protein NEMIN01_0661 [Nematocida minor]